jgi:DNA-binding NarL/FixJ family response regulator
MRQVQVILADPSPVVVCGFKNFLEKHPRVKVIREVMTLSGLEEALAENAGCVCIVDWQMASLESATRIAENGKLILSAMPESIPARRHALRIGVRGFIGAQQSAADIRKAVLTVANGQIWIGKTTAEAILNLELSDGQARTLSTDRRSELTTREKQVIQLACRGLKSRAIALELRISEPTVAHHLTSVYSKLGVKGRIGLILYAQRHSLQLAQKKTPIGEKVGEFYAYRHS